MLWVRAAHPLIVIHLTPHQESWALWLPLHWSWVLLFSVEEMPLFNRYNTAQLLPFEIMSFVQWSPKWVYIFNLCHWHVFLGTKVVTYWKIKIIIRMKDVRLDQAMLNSKVIAALSIKWPLHSKLCVLKEKSSSWIWPRGDSCWLWKTEATVTAAWQTRWWI